MEYLCTCSICGCEILYQVPHHTSAISVIAEVFFFRYTMTYIVIQISIQTV